jgi:Leucine-rich repeat (LRR) protein
MKKIIFSLILFFSLTLFANYDPIINIPDANFKAKLLQASPSNQIASTQIPVFNQNNISWNVTSYSKIDINNDGEIQLSEALEIKWLKIDNSNISDLGIIGSFTNLQVLNCKENQLTSLNLTNLLNLKQINCNDNQLNNLNVIGLTNLNVLNCDGNQLTSLNVSGLSNLKFFNFTFNPISNLEAIGCINLTGGMILQNDFINLNLSGTGISDLAFSGSIVNNLNVSNCNNLQQLQCNGSQMTSLIANNCINLNYVECVGGELTIINVSDCPNLLTLRCQYNAINNLNLSGCVGLFDLNCYHNQLTNLNVSSCLNLQILDLSSNQISSLNVSSCINLQELYCGINQLTNLNVNNLQYLSKIACSNNPLTNLNVSGCLNLEELYCEETLLSTLELNNLNNLYLLKCDNNNLTNLNISGCNNLQYINCVNNQLVSLNLGSITNLISLNCSYNSLNNLNINGCINLYDLNFESNQLVNINLSNCSNLNSLHCDANLLSSLDLSSCINLNTLQCSYNPVISINIKNGINQNDLDLFDNPNLTYVCCDESELLSVQYDVGPNCQVNTYCSFTPGGNYNTISGQFKFDFDNNDCDEGDYPVINAKLSSPSFSGTNTIYANNQGQYNGFTLQGTHTIIPQIENQTLFNITPPTAQVTFANSNNNTQTQNFCITPNGNQMDVEVIFTPLNPARPGFDADYKIVYRNIGNQVANGEVALTYMHNLMSLVSSSVLPTSQTANIITWSYTNLLPFETRTINLTFNINSPTETPPVNNDDILDFTANISPVSNDINSLNNSHILNQTVVGSYDPNDKTCLQGNTPGPEFIGKYVHYLIRFENTGTFFAENVVVRDDIDLAKFDIDSLVVLDASHSMLNTKISNGNRVEFIFQGIQLPFPPSEERHGYVLFKIKTKSNLTVGSTFSNKANIYFDYNWPIITNDEVSTITLLGQPSFEFSEFLSLYPNPANDMINLSAKADINLQSIEIYNTLGQLLMALPNDSNERSIDVSHLNSGTYMISVNTDKGKGHTKFIKK